MTADRRIRLSVHFSAALAALVGMILLAACQPLTPTPAAAPTATVTSEEAAETIPASVSAGQSATEAAPPVSIAFPDLDLEIPVKPMGWESVGSAGQRTTRWVVPEDAAGWALNSAGAGDAGNLVLAGYQTRGDAVFAALALGEIEVGQDILVTDEAGAAFTYRVVEVSEPLVLLGATAQERAQAAAYLAPTEDARLTLVTGWPADTTTHRIFVVAELASGAQ